MKVPPKFNIEQLWLIQLFGPSQMLKLWLNLTWAHTVTLVSRVLNHIQMKVQMRPKWCLNGLIWITRMRWHWNPVLWLGLHCDHRPSPRLTSMQQCILFPIKLNIQILQIQNSSQSIQRMWKLVHNYSHLSSGQHKEVGSPGQGSKAQKTPSLELQVVDGGGPTQYMIGHECILWINM